jgi:anti-sigma regulatory factor (Ser/Thr protein kinase)
LTPTSLTLPAELARAAELAAWVEGAITAWNLPTARAHALHLCAEEIFANIAMHAAPAEVTVWNGPQFDRTGGATVRA